MDSDSKTRAVVELYAKHINPGLARLMSFAGYGLEVRAEGCYIWDDEGKKYLDCLGGYGVFALGHRNPEVVATAKKALDTMPLSGKAFFSEPAGLLAQKLSQITPDALQYSFFCNSGAEAVEGAIKAARSASGKHKIISTVGGYHGKTLGALSATGREAYKKPFEPMLEEFVFVAYGDSKALADAVDSQTAAVLLEPIQGEAGIYVPPDNYLSDARKICDEKGALLIFDEVQTGFGRTGKMFGMDHSKVCPDLVMFAKALGGGVVPIGAFMGTQKVWDKFFGDNPLIHTSTFGGNPLATSCALTAIEVIEKNNLCENSAKMGERMKTLLIATQNTYKDLVSEVRGKGLMIGVEFSMDDVAELVIAQMVKRGVAAAYTLNNKHVIRFEPPLTITESEVDFACEVFAESVKETASLLSAINV